MTWLTNPFRFGGPPIVAIAPPAVWFETVFAYDATTGNALYELSPDTALPLYSVSKLLTALIVVERVGTLSNTVTVNSTDVSVVATNAGLLNNDVVSYQDLLEGLLIASGNDCSRCLGRHVGDLIYAAAGSTGNSGMTRFVEEMNLKATALELSSFTMHNPGGYVVGENTGSARDAAKLAALAEANATLQPIISATSGSIAVTGANARTITLTPVEPHNGRSGVLGWKVGYTDQVGTGNDRSSLVVVWEAPNGHKIAFAGLHNNAFIAYTHISMDHMIQQIPQDFPYLDPTNTLVPTDANIASVKLLVGADDGFTDESSSAHTVTANGDASRDSVYRLTGTHAILLDGTGDYLEVANSADFQFGSGDFTVECFFRWDNSLVKPSVDATFVSLWNESGNQRSWLLGFDTANNRIDIRASYAGSATSLTGWINPSVLVFGRGVHHLFLMRSGTQFRVGLNGSLNASLSIGANSLHASTASLLIGARRDGSGNLISYFPGRIDEVRITKGVARYSTSGWTLGSASHPARKWPRS